MDPTLTPAAEQSKEKALAQATTSDVAPMLDIVPKPETDIAAVVSTESAPVSVPEALREKPAESVLESAPERAPEVSQEQIRQPEPVVMAAPVIPVAPVKPQKERLEQEIEDILEEDLKDMYLAMSKEKQQEFRTKGELTRIAVRQLVQDAHKNVKKIFQLIRAWLKIIPGVNRYFLEQEAKIKTDKVIFVAEEEKRRGSKL